MTRLLSFRPLSRLSQDGNVSRSAVMSEPASFPGPIRWHGMLTAALREARQSGRPVMLAFAARWCPCSQEMERRTYADAHIVALAEGFHCVKVDVDTPYGRMLCAEYGVVTFPQVLFFRPDGQIIATRDGLCAAVELAASMRAVAAAEATRVGR